jgi:thioredoxin reductase (NADPH)
MSIGPAAASVFATRAKAPEQKAKPPLLAQVLFEFPGGQAALLFDGSTKLGQRDRTIVTGTAGTLESHGPDLGQQEVALVGGGNSAGQAAVFLSQHASRVHMLVRGPSLAASMSRYLIDRIEATPNIELRPHSELSRLHGELPAGLAGVSWRDRRSGREEERALRHVFLFVGAEPETRWLDGCGVAVDAHGFVLTGSSATPAAAGFEPAPLETSLRRLFAVGDVRAGSVKRVGGAIGEGAAAVAQIHRHLSRAVATA